MLGLFSLLSIDFDLTVLAALLAVIGYSLNDTIVVSDRIRENFRKKRRAEATQLIDRSLNQMLGRTLITSLTTLLVLFALFIFTRLLGSIDKIVPIDTLPSLPSLMILKKHVRLSFFNIPGQINIIPIDKPVMKNRVLKKFLLFVGECKLLLLQLGVL